MKVYLNLQTATLLYIISLSPFSFTLIPQTFFLKPFFQKAASRLLIFLFNVQDPVPYFATGLINVLQIFMFFFCEY